MSAFNEAWAFLKAEYEEQSVPFDELLRRYAESSPYFTHPENETYKELMQYQQEIENQKTPLTPIQDEERRYLLQFAMDEADHIQDLEEGR